MHDINRHSRNKTHTTRETRVEHELCHMALANGTSSSKTSQKFPKKSFQEERVSFLGNEFFQMRGPRNICAGVSEFVYVNSITGKLVYKFSCFSQVSLRQ